MERSLLEVVSPYRTKRIAAEPKEFIRNLKNAMHEEGDKEAEKILLNQFGINFVTPFNEATTVSVIVDGEVLLKR